MITTLAFIAGFCLGFAFAAFWIGRPTEQDEQWGASQLEKMKPMEEKYNEFCRNILEGHFRDKP